MLPGFMQPARKLADDEEVAAKDGNNFGVVLFTLIVLLGIAMVVIQKLMVPVLPIWGDLS